jgi:hypothetical protein
MELSIRQEKRSLLHRQLTNKDPDSGAAHAAADNSDFVDLLDEGDEPVHIHEPDDRSKDRILLKPMLIVVVVVMIFIVSAILTGMTSPIIEEEELEAIKQWKMSQPTRQPHRHV